MKGSDCWDLSNHLIFHTNPLPGPAIMKSKESALNKILNILIKMFFIAIFQDNVDIIYPCNFMSVVKQRIFLMEFNLNYVFFWCKKMISIVLIQRKKSWNDSIICSPKLMKVATNYPILFGKWWVWIIRIKNAITVYNEKKSCALKRQKWLIFHTSNQNEICIF